jgi:hypothetical protein
MFARNVALRLKPNCLNQFRHICDAQIVPLLRKQPGFRDIITFSMTGEIDVTAISLWETREQAEVYPTAGYPQVMQSLEPLLGGMPKLRVPDILNSTFHKVEVAAA